jgi:integrase
MFLQSEVVLFINGTGSLDLKQGAPALFLETAKQLELFETPSQFLNEHYVRCGSTPSRHTWVKAAYSLKSWFQYLQAIERDWIYACEQDRIDFRDVYLGSISQKTGRHYSTSGVRDSMVVVRSFYRYCTKLGTYHADIGGDGISHENILPMHRHGSHSVRTHSSVKDKDRALPKVRPGTKIHPLTVCDLKTLLHYLGPQAAARDGDQSTARDRLICDLGWAVGLRLSEINNLTTLQFMTLVPDLSEPFVGMSLTIQGKGTYTRQVIIPSWLVADVHAYMNHERMDSLGAYKTKLKHPTTRLFLAHKYSNSAGKPITNAAMQKMIREACLALGLVTIVEKTDPDTNRKFTYKTPRHSMHDLRHTYAVLTYHAERANGNPEPWKKIQAQLGHRSLQTTIDTYLSHVEVFTDQSGLLDVRRMLGL